MDHLILTLQILEAGFCWYFSPWIQEAKIDSNPKHYFKIQACRWGQANLWRKMFMFFSSSGVWCSRIGSTLRPRWSEVSCSLPVSRKTLLFHDDKEIGLYLLKIINVDNSIWITLPWDQSNCWHFRSFGNERGDNKFILSVQKFFTLFFLIVYVSDIESIVGDTGPGNSYADVAR